MSVAVCTICLAGIHADELSALHCGHTFHLECIKRWLMTSKSCPHCRKSASDRSLLPHIFLQRATDQDTSNTQDDTSQTVVADLLMQIDQLREEATQQQKDYTKKLSTLEKKLAREQKISRVREDRIYALEDCITEQKNLSAQLQDYKNLLKASEFYRVLVEMEHGNIERVIGEYLNDSGGLEAERYIELLSRQLKEKVELLKNERKEVTRCHEQIRQLRMKLDKQKQVEVALKEELNKKHLNGSQALVNKRLADVLAYSPVRSAMGSPLASRKNFSPSIMASAYSGPKRKICRRTGNGITNTEESAVDSNECSDISNSAGSVGTSAVVIDCVQYMRSTASQRARGRKKDLEDVYLPPLLRKYATSKTPLEQGDTENNIVAENAQMNTPHSRRNTRSCRSVGKRRLPDETIVLD